MQGMGINLGMFFPAERFRYLLTQDRSVFEHIMYSLIKKTYFYMTPTSWYGVEQNFLVLVFGQKNKPLSQVAKLNT